MQILQTPSQNLKYRPDTYKSKTRERKRERDNIKMDLKDVLNTMN